jgi:hypothetical protein
MRALIGEKHGQKTQPIDGTYAHPQSTTGAT